ncbi:hypothetical protein [Aeromonas caviae]|uniref:hypothetical protein n=1 Tax=Aeromonas caviae TaxID=648 RepID=UPI0022555CDE|nr:hypothetical protein [Aeromonas caviae]MCX4071485.1 hypothetical protein [Aeromonas caviae]
MTQTKYTANFYFETDGTLSGTEVCEGTVEGVDDQGFVNFRCVLKGQEQVVAIPAYLILESRIEAEKKIEAALAWKERRILKAALNGKVDFLPEILAEPKGVYFSGNPLRCGEPMIGFGAQTNAWGKQDNPQKVLQLAGAIWEDIEMLQGILFVLGFANNYAKKLVGKYVIIELNSLFMCLRRLSELDSDYKNTLFPALVAEVKRLESEHQFRAIRDKIAAHRDTNIDLIESTSFWNKITRHALSRHIAVFAAHVDEVLRRYPFEATSYFHIRRRIVNGVLGVQENAEYQTFDEPFKERSA